MLSKKEIEKLRSHSYERLYGSGIAKPEKKMSVFEKIKKIIKNRTDLDDELKKQAENQNMSEPEKDD
ncbi:hypothetical protein [uncultured Treponema sp.]|uniref:hypothetical protein n=1 Tax=uncultured Treponema sp. TaxID=162155 RepID=UPI0025D51946|nr:hypothetical protein [uncultured Treponema sp.]